MRVDWELLRATHPEQAPDDAQLVDWSRELANLVLGAVKARLLERGFLLQMGTPTSPRSAAEIAASAGGVGCEHVVVSVRDLVPHKQRKLNGQLLRAGHDLCPRLRMRAQDAVVADHVKPRRRDERADPREQIERLEDDGAPCRRARAS
jgi:hypothetical protein